MTLLPRIRTNRGNIGNDIWIGFPDYSSFEKTYLSGDEASGQTVLSVLGGSNFAANQYIVIGTPGAEQTEIRRISSVTASSITISSATSFDHNQGTLIVFLPFDQIELYSASSSGGSFSLLDTFSIRADANETYYQRASDANAVYYKARFKNSNDTTYSDYSDEVAATGYSFNTIGAVKRRALMQLGEKIGPNLTDEFLSESLFEGRREVEALLKKWSFRKSFDTDIANLAEGQYRVAVPSNLRDPNNPTNILGLRIGSMGRNITYMTKREMDAMYEGIRHATVATQPSVGATSLVLSNVRDFESSGSIQIAGNTITYTSKDNSTATLSGIPASGTGSIDTAHAVGVDVWQHASFGEPNRYTIFNSYIYFDVPIHEDFEGVNLYMDYFRKVVAADSDADEFDETDPDMFVSYLKYKIKDKLSKGKTDKSKDPDYQDYITRRTKMIMNERSGQDPTFSPDIGHLVDQD